MFTNNDDDRKKKCLIPLSLYRYLLFNFAVEHRQRNEIITERTYCASQFSLYTKHWNPDKRSCTHSVLTISQQVGLSIELTVCLIHVLSKVHPYACCWCLSVKVWSAAAVAAEFMPFCCRWFFVVIII